MKLRADIERVVYLILDAPARPRWRVVYGYGKMFPSRCRTRATSSTNLILTSSLINESPVSRRLLQARVPTPLCHGYPLRRIISSYVRITRSERSR